MVQDEVQMGQDGAKIGKDSANMDQDGRAKMAARVTTTMTWSSWASSRLRHQLAVSARGRLACAI